LCDSRIVVSSQVKIKKSIFFSDHPFDPTATLSSAMPSSLQISTPTFSQTTMPHSPSLLPLIHLSSRLISQATMHSAKSIRIDLAARSKKGLEGENRAKKKGETKSR
jgi:hypothetical protein